MTRPRAHVRRIGALLSVTALLAIAAVPSATVPAPSVTRSAATVGDADLRLTAGPEGLRPDGGARDFLDHVRAAAEDGRPFTVRDAFAAHAERLGLPPFDHPEEAPEEAPVQVGPVGHMGTEVYAVPTGDVDGDGRDDLYAIVFAPDGHVHVEARRGLDGTVLWTLDAADAGSVLPLPVGDLDGDGTTDLLVWAFAGTEEFDEACDDRGCAFTYRVSGVWRYGLASGTDGATRWIREEPIELIETYEDRSSSSGYEFSVTVSGTNPYLAPWVAGDLDEDGRTELALELVEAVDIELRYRSTNDPLWLAGREEFVYAGDIATSLTAVRDDGSEQSVLARGDDRGMAVGGFADLDGDGGGDVHLVEYTLATETSDCITAYVVWEEACLVDDRTPSTESLVAVRGDGSEMWRVDMGEAYLWAWDVPDVDGDGGADLVVNDLVSGAGGVHAGGDGGRRWWLEGDQERFSLMIPGGDLDADGTVDVVRLSDGGDAGADELVVVIERYAGADGTPGPATRYAEPYDPDSEWVFGSAGVWFDRELDGVPGSDLAVELTVTDDGGTRGGTTLERGVDGEAINRLPADQGTPVGLVDLTGDGTHDMVAVTGWATIVICEIHEDGSETCQSNGDGSGPALAALRLPELAPLWRYDTWDENVWGWMWPLGDLDGQPGSEMLEQVFLMEADAAGFTSGFAVRDGTDLALRWRLGASRPR